MATRTVHRRLVASLDNAEQFGLRMKLEAKLQDVRNTDTVVWISDGGRGFWGIFAAFFSFCIGILDFFHAAQNLWKVAKEWLDGRTNKSRQWFKKDICLEKDN